MHSDQSNTDSRSWLTLSAYAFTAVILYLGWRLHDERYIVASEGVGYLLGIIGSSCMVLLLLYPLRKRARFLRRAGPIKHWFRVHMILGIVGPVLVLFHSNFTLGSTNSRIALFCTIVVAGSGILGRYLYARIHRGLYGQQLTFDAVRSEVEGSRSGKSSAFAGLLPLINERMRPLEDAAAREASSLTESLWLALQVSCLLVPTRLRLRREVRDEVARLAQTSDVIAQNRKRLLVNVYRYVSHRIGVLRKFAQFQACERLFSLWHVVHYPLFIVLVVAAVIHIVAVHMF